MIQLLLMAEGYRDMIEGYQWQEIEPFLRMVDALEIDRTGPCVNFDLDIAISELVAPAGHAGSQ
jgi:hypothetical protein